MAATPSYLQKINRAETHLETLEAHVKGWLERKAYTVTVERNSHVEESVLRFHLVEPVPEILPVLLGDCLFNMRASLDHIVCALAAAKKGGDLTTDEARRLQFIIADTRKVFDKDSLRRLAGLSDKAKAVIERMQPYHRGVDGVDFARHALWVFNELSNADKQRAISFVAASAQRFSYDGVNHVVRRFDLPSEVALDDGAELLRFDAGYADPSQEAHLDLAFTVDISFAKTSFGNCTNVVPLMRFFFDYIRHTIIPALESCLDGS